MPRLYGRLQPSLLPHVVLDRSSAQASRERNRQALTRRAREATARHVSRAVPVRAPSPASDDSNWLDIGAKFRRRAMLWWPSGGKPERVLIVKKWNDAPALDMLRLMAHWLRGHGIEVMAEPAVCADEAQALTPWDRSQPIPDFCITLGGDGTVLHAASLFHQDQALPPILAFAMGTLGFLTPFEASNFEPLLTRVVEANERAVFCTLRTRLTCEVYAGDERVDVQQAFNEACIDRGPGLYMLLMECYVDGNYVTTIQGDGLLVSTPSGSTAYNLSAGGPMVAPSVPCVVLTPIAPHTLSFRPIVVAETSDIVIHIPADFPHPGARVCFDGKNEHWLRPNDSVRMNIAQWPLPMITAETMDQDWFVSITEKLMWNAIIKKTQRPPEERQLPFPAECRLDDQGWMRTAGGPGGPSCVAWPDPDNLMAAHHTGQSVADVFAGMPLYCPADGGGNCSRSEGASSSSSSSGEDEVAGAAPRAGAGGAAGFVSFSGTHRRVTGNFGGDSWDERTLSAMTSSDFDDLGSSGGESPAETGGSSRDTGAAGIDRRDHQDSAQQGVGSNGSGVGVRQEQSGAEAPTAEAASVSGGLSETTAGGQDQSRDRDCAAPAQGRQGDAADAGPG